MSSAEMQKKAAYSVIVRRGTRFEIPMTGSSWTYIGASGAQEGIRYQNRRYETGKVVFVFDPVVTGEYLLEFTRQDILLDELESLFVRVIVEPENGTDPAPSPGRGAISPAPSMSAPIAGSPSSEAPDSPLSASPSSGTAGASPSAAKDALSESGAASPAGLEDFSTLDGPALLAKAMKDVESGKADSSLAALEAYSARYGLGDEYLYWLARALELPGPRRDILKSRSLYVQLMEEYPESLRFDASDARIEYIDRRYLDIR